MLDQLSVKEDHAERCDDAGPDKAHPKCLGAFSAKHHVVHQWMVVLGVLCAFLALDFAATAAIHPLSSVTTHNQQVLRRRRLEDIPIGEQVQQAIQDSMASGELGADNPAVVNVSWVPLEDLKDDDEGTRDVDPPTITKDDDELDRLWIIIMVIAGLVVCVLIAMAYLCMRRAEEEGDENDDDQVKEGDGPDNGAVTNDEEEEEEEDDEEEEEVEESSEEETESNIVEPDDPKLGRFEMSR